MMAENQLVLYRNNPVQGPRNSVASLLGRVLGARIDLRRGGLLPEELPREQAEKLLGLLTNRFPKTVDPVTGQVSYTLGRAGILTAPGGEPCLASLCREAQTIAADALRVLPTIHALDPEGDPELVEAGKAILDSEFRALMHELCQSQPRFFQIENLLREARLHVGRLQVDCGSDREKLRVNSLEEDTVVISLRVLADYLACLETSFCGFIAEHFSLACLLQEITFALQTIGETVPQVRTQLFEDGVTESDLRVLRLTPPRTSYVREGCPPIAETITAEAFLSLNEYEAERMIQVVERAGKLGTRSIQPYVKKIVEQFIGILGKWENYQYLHHLTKDDTFDLVRTVTLAARKPKAELEKELQRFQTTASPAVFEFVQRYPRTLFFLFKLQSQWQEVLELIEKVEDLDHRLPTGRVSDQGAIQQ